MVRRCGTLLVLAVAALLGTAAAIAETGPPVMVAVVEAGTDAVLTDFNGITPNIAAVTGEEATGALALGTNAVLYAAGWRAWSWSTEAATARQGDHGNTGVDADRHSDTAAHRLLLRSSDIVRGYRLVVV